MSSGIPKRTHYQHAYERNHAGRPWVGYLHGPASATGDEMVAAVDTVGVDGALLVSPYSLYRFDASYAHPARFGLIKPVDRKPARQTQAPNLSGAPIAEDGGPKLRSKGATNARW